MVEIYCSSDPSSIFQRLRQRFDTDSRFPNVRLIQTDDQTVFFDTHLKQMVAWASPLQCYLELMIGDKREKETAAQVRKYILKNIDQLG